MMCVVLCVFCMLLFMKMWFFFFCKQKTAYEMRISDWSSDVCASDLPVFFHPRLCHGRAVAGNQRPVSHSGLVRERARAPRRALYAGATGRARPYREPGPDR